MSYQFTLYIDPKDVQQLVAQNFYFAAVKTTGGSTALVQWFAVLIEGDEIHVSWNVEYEVFFTTTAVANGATIRQGSRTGAQPGQSYGYSQASWAPSSLPTVTASQIGVLNDYAQSQIRTFGVNQVVNISGQSRRTPIAVAPIAYFQGSAKFEPREIVDIYFSLKTWDDNGTVGGVVVESVTQGIKLTLKSGAPQYVRYSGGKWTPLTGPPDGAAVARSLSARPTWYARFYFDLAAPVSSAAFADWVEKTLKNVLTNSPGITVNTSFVLEFISDKNRTEEILALKGKYYEAPLVHTLLEDGSEEVVGRRVKIIDVTLDLPLFEQALKQLPAGAGPAAVHSH